MGIFNPLVFTSLTPLFGVFILSFIPNVNKNLLKVFTFSVCCLTFIFSLLLWLYFDSSDPSFQFLVTVK